MREIADASIGELVADAVDRQHVAGISRIWLELPPHVLHVRIDRAVERFDAITLNGIDQLRAREHAAGLRRERREPARMRATSSFGLNGFVT